MAEDTAPMTAEERAVEFLDDQKLAMYRRHALQDLTEQIIGAERDAAAQARAEAFAAGMEEAAGIAEQHVGRGYRSPIVACSSVVAAIRARAAEGAKAEKGDGWRLGPPGSGVLCLMEIEYSVNGHLTKERIVAYVDDRDDLLHTETGDLIGWLSEVVVRHCPLPPAGDPTP